MQTLTDRSIEANSWNVIHPRTIKSLTFSSIPPPVKWFCAAFFCSTKRSKRIADNYHAISDAAGIFQHRPHPHLNIYCVTWNCCLINGSQIFDHLGASWFWTFFVIDCFCALEKNERIVKHWSTFRRRAFKDMKIIRKSPQWKFLSTFCELLLELFFSRHEDDHKFRETCE